MLTTATAVELANDFLLVLVWMGTWSLFETSGLLAKWSFNASCVAAGLLGRAIVVGLYKHRGQGQMS